MSATSRCRLKPVFKYDDSLDAFGVHGVGGFLGAILTGVFVSAELYKHGSGNDLPGVDLFGNKEAPRLLVQFVAAGVSVVYAFGLTLVLVKVIDLTWGFCLEPKAEGEGLDMPARRSRLRLGLATETMPEQGTAEPRAATVPPNGQKHFTVIVEGTDNRKLIHAWSIALPGRASRPAAVEFKQVYPFFTTVQGNRFRFRGGDPEMMSESLQRIFQSEIAGSAIKAKVEG